MDLSNVFNEIEVFKIALETEIKVIEARPVTLTADYVQDYTQKQRALGGIAALDGLKLKLQAVNKG